MTEQLPKMKKSLAATHPALAKQAHGWDPNLVTPASHRKVEWICELGHVWSASLGNRTAKRYRNGVISACPTCIGKQLLVGFNDLATTHPNIAAEAFGWDPKTVTNVSTKVFTWRGKCGHEWSMSVNARAQRGYGCIICRGFAVSIGSNDLATTHPEIAKDADGWDPLTVVAGSHNILSWRCEFGHKWRARVNNRTSSRKSQCPVCSNKEVLIGFNDLATTQPKIAKDADGWDPKTVTMGSSKKVKWKCEFEHTWEGSVASRTYRQSGCPICSGKKLWVGLNDLATTHPNIAAEAFGWDPKTVTRGSARKVKWKCEFEHIWLATIGNRTAREPTGCPTCAASGFDPNKPSWLYFIADESRGLLQIGITGEPEVRIEKHRKMGWEIISIRGPIDGYAARKLEVAILKSLKKRKAMLALSAGHKKFSGHTESWTKQSLKVSSLDELLKLVHEDEAI